MDANRHEDEFGHVLPLVVSSGTKVEFHSEKQIADIFRILASRVSKADIMDVYFTSKIIVALTSKRLKLDLTRKQFAKELGTRKKNVKRWENGDYVFSIPELCEYCAILDLDLDILIQPEKMKEDSGGFDL